MSMANDPMRGMSVDEKKAAGTATHGGKTFYFCSAGSKATFEKALTKDERRIDARAKDVAVARAVLVLERYLGRRR